MKSLRTIPYRAWLLLVIVALVIVLGINPIDRRDYILEHAPTAALLIYLIIFDRKCPISNIAASLMFWFLTLHAIGAHYLYSNVPYDDWLRAIIGTDTHAMFGFERNHYDRLVHFSFGVLMTYPMREVLSRYLVLGPVSGLVVAVTFLAVGSKIYELAEWLIAVVMAPEAAERYNGQQGDMFDAQKDMGLALVGSIISALIIGATERFQWRPQPRPI